MTYSFYGMALATRVGCHIHFMAWPLGWDDIFILWHGNEGGMTYLFDDMAKGCDDIFILWHGD